VIHNIAKLMVKATEVVLYQQQRAWLKQSHPDVTLLVRVGGGFGTHCTRYTNRDYAITYGIDMIANKLDSENCGADWATHKEIVNRGYFNGSTTIQNLLAHTVIHEYAHFFQFLTDGVKKNSIHNAAFYKIVDNLYRAGLAEDVLMYMRQYSPFNALKFTSKHIKTYTLNDVDRGDFVKLYASYGWTGRGRVLSKHRTRMKVLFGKKVVAVYPSQISELYKLTKR
tara:strand:+ start:6837 stop:7511 length:675 start_codon:yes stop_codon:yes gene_type:complete